MLSPLHILNAVQVIIQHPVSLWIAFLTVFLSCVSMLLVLETFLIASIYPLEWQLNNQTNIANDAKRLHLCLFSITKWQEMV